MDGGSAFYTCNRSDCDTTDSFDGYSFRPILYIDEDKTSGGTLGTVTGNETNNNTVQDSLGNQVVVPPGFIVQNPNDNVTDGIIIQDVDKSRPTYGSEFVWIPVGTVNKPDGGTETIKLSRYTFDENGKATDQGDKVINDYIQEEETSRYGNAVAKDIKQFLNSSIDKGGYYIGRYEARTPNKRTRPGNELPQITEKPGDYVYNYIMQDWAGNLCKEMYNNSNFTSDLVNSYAWDTTLIFLQTFDDRIDKTIPYSRQGSSNSTLAEKGTNNLTDIKQQDVVCNIYDMASNILEFSTEANISNFRFPSISRGSHYSNFSFTTSTRGGGSGAWEMRNKL